MPNTPKDFIEETMIAFRTLLKDYKIELSEKFTNQDDRELIENFLTSALLAQKSKMLKAVEEVIRKERDTWAKESIGDKALQSLERAVKETLSANQ